MIEKSEVCRRIIYSGHVQGVGFRHTAQKTSQQYDVCGYVRNLENGQVELIAQGSVQELDKFLSHLKDLMKDFIDKVEQEDKQVEVYYGFTIKR